MMMMMMMNMAVGKAIRRLAEELLSLHGRILQAFLSPIISPLALLYSSGAVKKVGYGLVGAVHMGVIQMVLMAVAVAAGLMVVRVWMEEPIVVQERLNFDFRAAKPVGVVRFESNMMMMIPVGRKFHVSLLLFMPESPYNRQLGVFQVSAELLSSSSKSKKDEGVILRSSSSQSCMLHFSSAPVRLARTLVMAMPLILGLSSETQHLHLPCLLKHTHDGGGGGGYEIRVTLSPRAGTFELPQLYDAEIVVKSEPPWSRDLVRRWKWTLSVWTSIYLYLALLLILLSTFGTPFFTPFLLLIFMQLPSPTPSARGEVGVGHDHSGGGGLPPLSASEVIRRMRQRRRNRTTVTTTSASTVTTATYGEKCLSDHEEVASSHHPAA